MAKLNFKDLGRDKWQGSIDIPDNLTPDEVAEYAYREAKKHLMTRFPETEYDASTNKGEVSAGCRTVGIFHVSFKS